MALCPCDLATRYSPRSAAPSLARGRHSLAALCGPGRCLREVKRRGHEPETHNRITWTQRRDGEKAHRSWSSRGFTFQCGLTVWFEINVTLAVACRAPFRRLQLWQLGDIRHNPWCLKLSPAQSNCSDFSCGWPMQAGRPFSRNFLWVIPQRTQAFESKSK